MASDLSHVKTSQSVLFKQLSFLWCPAEGAPAPNIVWRKNGIVVQNSTSVKYNLTLMKETKDNYSCEVTSQGNWTKKNLVLLIEREYQTRSYNFHLSVYY